MNVYIALFRGINVGGKNMLPMKELVILFKNAGVDNVKTYINSGNVIFTSEAETCRQLQTRISSGIESKYGFTPAIHILELKELEEAISGNPFPQSEPETLHVGFLSAAPKNPDLQKLGSLKIESERFKLIGRIFYLHAPEGVGRSKLAANSERLLGVSMTDRNLRTACKLRDMACEMRGNSK
jgi:uncharacterized protein (DUF1697 family)